MTRLILLLALAIIPAAARAEPVDVVVRLTAGDVASAGKARLKVARAIEQICRSYAVVEPYQWPEIDQCRKAAWANVAPQLASLRGRDRIRLGSR